MGKGDTVNSIFSSYNEEVLGWNAISGKVVDETDLAHPTTKQMASAIEIQSDGYSRFAISADLTNMKLRIYGRATKEATFRDMTSTFFGVTELTGNDVHEVTKPSSVSDIKFEVETISGPPNSASVYMSRLRA